jgi:pre-mRNA-splicing helicase BRR2
MSRPAYSAIRVHATGRQSGEAKPALVFVPSRKYARLTALDLLTHAAADGDPERFRCAPHGAWPLPPPLPPPLPLPRPPQNRPKPTKARQRPPTPRRLLPLADLEPFLARVKDATLRHSLSYGVGYLHETMGAQEAAVARTLFASGAIQVLVATSAMCWGMDAAAQLVVIMGTQYFDPSGSSAADYPVADLIQMVGRRRAPPSAPRPFCRRSRRARHCRALRRALRADAAAPRGGPAAGGPRQPAWPGRRGQVRAHVPRAAQGVLQ